MRFCFIFLTFFICLSSFGGQILKIRGRKIVVKGGNYHKGDILKVKDEDGTTVGRLKVKKVKGKLSGALLTSGIARKGYKTIRIKASLNNPHALTENELNKLAAIKSSKKRRRKKKKKSTHSKVQETSKALPSHYATSYIAGSWGNQSSSKILDNSDGSIMAPGSWMQLSVSLGSISKNGFIFESELAYGIGDATISAVTFETTDYMLNFAIGTYIQPWLYVRGIAGIRYTDYDYGAGSVNFKLVGIQYGGAIGWHHNFNDFFFVNLEGRYMLSHYSKSLSSNPLLNVDADIDHNYMNLLFRFGMMY